MKTYRALSAGLVAGFVLTCLVSTTPLSAQVKTIKISSPTVNDVSHEWMKQFKAGVEARAGGKLKVDIYPASQLGQVPATIEGLALGTIEIVTTASSFYVGLEPRFQLFDANGLFTSMQGAQKLFADAELRKRLAELGAAKGLELIAAWPHGPLTLVSHRAIRKVEDFKGQKIRVPGAAPLQIEPFRKLGAQPISMPLGEVLPAMQTKTIDGLIASGTVFTAFKYYDLSKHQTRLPGAFLIVPAMASKKFLASLGPELEAIVREEAFKAQRGIEVFGVTDVVKTAETWKANGGELIDMSEADQAAYRDLVNSILPGFLARNAKLKEDHEAFLAAAKR